MCNAYQNSNMARELVIFHVRKSFMIAVIFDYLVFVREGCVYDLLSPKGNNHYPLAFFNFLGLYASFLVVHANQVLCEPCSVLQIFVLLGPHFVLYLQCGHSLNQLVYC